jgi:hypothetical protein
MTQVSPAAARRRKSKHLLEIILPEELDLSVSDQSKPANQPRIIEIKDSKNAFKECKTAP